LKNQARTGITFPSVSNTWDMPSFFPNIPVVMVCPCLRSRSFSSFRSELDLDFDPGGRPFGLWVSNENWADGGVFTQPAMVTQMNERLRAQPYKVMIYPNRDGKTGRLIANSYVIGWEYSTNDASRMSSPGSTTPGSCRPTRRSRASSRPTQR
jgi:hypothetical protein